MTIVLNGTTGITNDGGYTGDGVVFADTTPANTLVTTTGGNVGIGTSSPTAKLNVSRTDSTLIGLFSGTTRGARIGTNSTYSFIEGVDNTGSASYQPFMIGGADVRFTTSDVERMRLDASGNVGIGTTSTSGYKLAVSDGTTFSVVHAGGGASYYGAITNHPVLFINNNTERMRLDTSGNLLVGSSGFDTRIGAFVAGGADRGIFQAAVVGISNGFTVRYISGAMQYTMSGLANGTVSSSSGVLSASSDQNMKVADGEVESALDKVNSLKPRYFYWKDADGNANLEQGRQLGFYAQEVYSIIPEASPEPVKEHDGWGIYDRALVATLTAAIQEQQAIITDLKARIETLESK